MDVRARAATFFGMSSVVFKRAWRRFCPASFQAFGALDIIKSMKLKAFTISALLLLVFCTTTFVSASALAFLNSPSSSESSARSKQTIGSSTDADLPKPFAVYKNGLEQNNYLAPLLQLRSREAEYLASKELRADYLEYMTLLCSYVGEFDAAYSYEEMFLSDLDARTKRRERNAKDLTSSPVDDYKPVDALTAIASVADREQVL